MTNIKITLNKLYFYLKNLHSIIYLILLNSYLKQESPKTFKKQILDDVTIIIPVFYDFEDRITNIKHTLENIRNFFDVKIIIAEAGIEPKFKCVMKDKNIDYHFFYDNSKIFHRTKYLNIIMRMCLTKFVINLDADILINPHTVYESILMLRNGKADVSIPYNGVILDLPYEEILVRINKNRLTILDQIDFPLKKLASKWFCKDVGGIFIFDRLKYKNIGFENENIKSWGPEDQERYHRCKKMGLKIARTNNVLYHQRHTRGINSEEIGELKRHNWGEFNKIKRMNRRELEEYIKIW